MRNNKFLLVFIFAITLFSCEKEIEITLPEAERKLVVEGNIEQGQPPFLMLTKTQGFFDPTDLNSIQNSFVHGATVTVSNGTNTVQLTELCTSQLPDSLKPAVAELIGVSLDAIVNFDFCLYSTLDPTIFGEIGKTYDLTINFEGKTYGASTKIEIPVPLDLTYWKPDGSNTNYGYSWATLSDPVGQYDAYMWEVKRINQDVNGDPLDANFQKPFSPVFDDEFFDGLTFDFFFDNPSAYGDTIPEDAHGLFTLGDTLVIKFSKIDKAVFEFLEKKEVQLVTAGNPFATPTNIPNNLSGGALGIWAGFSPVFDTLVCVP